jgi:Zn-dependent protease with chaperone function
MSAHLRLRAWSLLLLHRLLFLLAASCLSAMVCATFYLLLLIFLPVFSPTTMCVWIAIALWEWICRQLHAGRYLDKSIWLIPLDRLPPLLLLEQFRDVVEGLARRQRKKTPRILINMAMDPTSNGNAFSHEALFGRGALVFDLQLLMSLTDAEQRGLAAHELRHHGARSRRIRWILDAVTSILLRMTFYCTAAAVVFVPVTLWLNPAKFSGVSVQEMIFRSLAYLGLLLLVMFLRELLLGFMARCSEILADVSGTLDLDGQPGLAHALERCERNSLPYCLSACPESGRRRQKGVLSVHRRWARGGMRLLMLAHPLFSTHPSREHRCKLLTWAFGPFPPLPEIAESVVIVGTFVEELEG